MKKLITTILMGALLCSLPAFAQKSKHGIKTVSGTEIVNEYDYLTSNANAGDVSITVNASDLNSNNRFSGVLEPGDLIFIVQVQGVTIQSGNGGDFNHGTIIDYNNCGNYEFAEVAAVPSATEIELSCALKNDYTAAGKVVVVRVPRYSALDIPNSATITADTWDGEKGGFLVVEVEGDLDLEGEINMTGKGFRGAPNTNINGGIAGAWGRYATNDFTQAALKGEGVAGYYTEYDLLDGRYGQGANANAGGGGCSVDAGGGGGANAGDINVYTGKGNPSLVIPAYANAWEQEAIGFSVSSSSGGGRGGYSRSSKYSDPYTSPLNDYGIWGADGRRDAATGFGGRPLDYSSGKIFLGGGGGQGFGVDRDLSAGGNGGGLVFLRVEGEITGAGNIVSNGEEGVGMTTNFLAFSNLDGAGGGGAGGTVVLEVQNGISAITVDAIGGKGGDIRNDDFFETSKNFGPGGGGGGGYVKSTYAITNTDISGGMNGEMFSGTFTGVFEPNGATIGGEGEVSVEASSFPVLTAQHDTICGGETANLSVTAANLPGGAIITWYDDYSNGNVVGTGLTYSDNGITSDSVFYVGLCPGTFKVPVYVEVQSAITADVVQDTVSTCSGSPAQLQATGGDTYTWFPSGNLNRSDSSIVEVITNSSTTIYVEVSLNGSCSDTDSVYIEISPSLNVNLGSDKTMCFNDSVTITATGGTIYNWENETGALPNNTSSIVVSPNDTMQYKVLVQDGLGCQSEDSIMVNVIPALSINAPGTQNLCANEEVNLVVSHTGGSGEPVTYIWDDGVFLGPSQNLSWSTNGSIEVKVVDNVYGCQDSTTFNIVLHEVSADFTYAGICLTTETNFNATAAGNGTIVSYDWDLNGTSRTGSAVDYIFPSTGVKNVELIVTDNVGCADTVVKSLTIEDLPFATFSVSPNSVCEGYEVIYTDAYINNSNYMADWDFGNGITSNTHSGTLEYSAAGVYYIDYTVTDLNGCSRTGTDSIEVKIGPEANFTIPSKVKIGEDINLTNTSVNGQIYSWRTHEVEFENTTNAVYEADSVTTKCFELYVVASSGCVDSVTQCVEIEGEDLVIPNVFTPNNDGRNDAFELLNSNGKTFDIEVYNRWGALVYSKTNYINQWKGQTNEGRDLADGTYFIVLTEQTDDGPIIKNGYIYLTR